MPKKMQLRQVDARGYTFVLFVAAALSVLLLLAGDYAREDSARIVAIDGFSGTPANLEEPVDNQTVFIKGGCFRMGNSGDEGVGDKRPLHEVCIDDFYMLRHEVTAGEFREFVRATGYRTDAEKGNGCYNGKGDFTVPYKSLNWESPGFPQSELHPVVCVSWNDAVQYITWKTQVDGRNYRLPTEAEWEFAARSRGLLNEWSGTNLESELDYYAWYEKTAEGISRPVGQKRANGIGLYDMSGNVREWVSELYYLQSPKYDQIGSESGEYRVTKGGSWSSDGQGVRVASRSRLPLFESSADLGFRIVHAPGYSAHSVKKAYHIANNRDG